jgi:LPXTG-motif cell wall-anchored protein
MSPSVRVPHRTLAVVAVTALAATGFAAVGSAPRPASAEGIDYVFNVNCPISHFGSDDPIVAPEIPGASHRHAFYGNSTTDAFTTTKSLMASKSTCERDFATADRSAYWVPTLYRKLPGGEPEEVRLSADNQHLSAYYRRSGGSTGYKVKPIPRGLRMIAGDPFATRPQSTLDVAWRCNGDGRDYVADIPNCSAGTVLQAIVGFPDCWDGKNLDSPNHRAHMAPSKGDEGSCPETHPVKLPQLTFEISFRLAAAPGATYELSSGGRYSLHGDFFAAWDDRVQSALVNSCLNAGRYCENIERSKVDLSAAGPVMRGREPTRVRPSSSIPATHAEHTTHVPATPRGSVAAAHAAVGKQTGVGAGALAGVGGAVLIGSAVFYWRRRRRYAGGAQG